ncbi:flagellar protein FlhE [Brenneria sp. 4F2]|nr:flagellar protein FlhE [Brenneria bubanii]
MSQIADKLREYRLTGIIMRPRCAHLAWRRYLMAAMTVFFLSSVDCAQAQGSGGSWGDEGKHWVVTQRGRAAVSPIFRASEKLPQTTRVTSVHWQYRLTRKAIPSGLKVMLCTAIRCMELHGGKGSSLAFNGDWAGNEFYFSFFLPGKGVIKPPIRVFNSQLIVNYQH